MEKQLTPWGFFECDFWAAIGSGVFQFSTPLHVGLFIQPDYNDKLPSSLRQESGLYQGSLAYSQAVVAYHHIFDIEHCVFDQETVQQAHILMSHGNIASSDLLTQHEKPTAYFKLFVWIWLLLAIFMNIGERKADKQVTRTILNPLD